MRLNPQEYCDNCWDKVGGYIKGVQNNEIIVGQYIKIAVDKFVSDLSNKEKY
jgi:hypothetical protein